MAQILLLPTPLQLLCAFCNLKLNWNPLLPGRIWALITLQAVNILLEIPSSLPPFSSSHPSCLSPPSFLFFLCLPSSYAQGLWECFCKVAPGVTWYIPFCLYFLSHLPELVHLQVFHCFTMTQLLWMFSLNLVTHIKRNMARITCCNKAQHLFVAFLFFSQSWMHCSWWSESIKNMRSEPAVLNPNVEIDGLKLW